LYKKNLEADVLTKIEKLKKEGWQNNFDKWLLNVKIAQFLNWDIEQFLNFLIFLVPAFVLSSASLRRISFIGIATIELQSADSFSKLFYKFYLNRDQPFVIAMSLNNFVKWSIHNYFSKNSSAKKASGVVIARSEALVCAKTRRGNLLYKYLSCYYFKNQIATAHARTQFHAMGFAMTTLKAFSPRCCWSPTNNFAPSRLCVK
jgi:hypothetical protein